MWGCYWVRTIPFILLSLYWSFCWIYLDLSCRCWVINSWPHSLASSYSGCSACCCTWSSIVSIRWSHNYAKPSTRIKSTSFKTRRQDLNWSGSKIFQVGLRSRTFQNRRFGSNMESTEARHVFVIEEEESTPSGRGKLVISAILGLIVIVILIIVVKLV